jgi:outer membrane lipoprotein carrier protein
MTFLSPGAQRVVFFCAATLAFGLPQQARADAVEALRNFAKQVQSARADFAQTVTSPDGAKRKTSTGRFEFLRPNRFRFDYLKPYEQQIVADGQKVWLYDPDLNQVTVRGFDQALGATPAAVLAGAAIDRDFTLQPLPDQGGLQWVQATPRNKDGSNIRELRVAFRGSELAALDIVDGFGQHSRLDFSKVESNPTSPAVGAQRFRFQAPAGADVVQQ